MSGARHRHSSTVRSDLLELSRHLRQEKLYVQHERDQLRELNGQVRRASERLAHTSWVAHQQRQNLDGLALSAPSRDQQSSPAAAFCQKANLIERTAFQDAYRHLGHHEVSDILIWAEKKSTQHLIYFDFVLQIVYSEFLRALRSKPHLLAVCLAAGDKQGLPQVSDAVSAIFSGLYGSCLMPEDERLTLQLLHHLMQMQLTSAANPRKLLRQSNCAFTRLYKAFNEQTFTAKLFLTSALYEPILSLLTDDEIFLDIDPSKAIIRFVVLSFYQLLNS